MKPEKYIVLCAVTGLSVIELRVACLAHGAADAKRMAAKYLGEHFIAAISARRN